MARSCTPTSPPGCCAQAGCKPRALPDGLAALHQAWWQQLGRPERWLAAVIAAAGEPLDLPLWAAVAGMAHDDAQHWLRRWQPFLEVIDNRIQIYHPATRTFIVEQSGDQLAGAHAAYVMLARERYGAQLEQVQPET